MGSEAVRCLILQCAEDRVVFSCSDGGVYDEVQATGDMVHPIHTAAEAYSCCGVLRCISLKLLYLSWVSPTHSHKRVKMYQGGQWERTCSVHTEV